MVETTLCGSNVEFGTEIQQVVDSLNSREPEGHVNELSRVGQRWWGDEPQLPVGAQYPHHEECVLEDAYLRWLKLSGWVLRHPTEISKRVGLTAITWVYPSLHSLSNYIHCCVTQVTQKGTIQGRAYKYWVSLAPELRPNGGKQPPRDIFQPVEMGLTDNVVVFGNLLDTPGWWPVECAVTNANDKRLRGRWEEFPFRQSRQQLQEERDSCKFQFDELEMVAGPAPFTLQDPAIGGFLQGLEALVAWGDYELFAPWNGNPTGMNHPDKKERFAAASSLLHQAGRKNEVIVPQASVVVDRNYLGSCPQFIQKKVLKRKDTLCLPYQYLLPSAEHPVDLPELELMSPFAGAAYPQVLLDFEAVPSHQVVRMTASEMDKAFQFNHDWKRMFSPKKEQDPWANYKAQLLKAVRGESDASFDLVNEHPGYAVKLSGVNNLYRAEKDS
ncbi:MAG: hypothetical protein WDA42_05570 [Candidatus Bathyarchaeia archaeon]|jgi:hypothetical protein